MSTSSMAVEGIIKGADFLGMTGLQSTAEKTLGHIKSGADFADSIVKSLNSRITENKGLSKVIGAPEANGEYSNFQRAKSLFYNRQGERQNARIGGAIAGSYMAANVVGNGSLGIPFISTASWNR